MKVYEKLSKIQCILKAPKNQYNAFGKYNYRNCEDILEAVKPHLDEYKCCLTLSDGLISVLDRIYVEATATFVDCETGQQVIVRASAREEETKKGMDSSQITGSSSSYARKYALNGMFCIDDTKDSDTTNTHGKDSAPKKQAVAGVPKVKNSRADIISAISEKPELVSKYLAEYKEETGKDCNEIRFLTTAFLQKVAKRDLI